MIHYPVLPSSTLSLKYTLPVRLLSFLSRLQTRERDDHLMEMWKVMGTMFFHFCCAFMRRCFLICSGRGSSSPLVFSSRSIVILYRFPTSSNAPTPLDQLRGMGRSRLKETCGTSCQFCIFLRSVCLDLCFLVAHPCVIEFSCFLLSCSDLDTALRFDSFPIPELLSVR